MSGSSVTYVTMMLGSAVLPPTVVITDSSRLSLVGLTMGNDRDRCDSPGGNVSVAFPGIVCVCVIVTVAFVSVTVLVVGLSSVLVTFLV